MQQTFIQHLKNQLPEDRSIIDEIADILNINYDAAYRRVNNKTNLSLEEAVILAKHFKISLNKLFEVGSQQTLIAEKSPKIVNTAGLEGYFKASLQNLAPLTKMKSASITYSAKDIPLFYTLTDSFLTRYKIYVWLKFLNEDGSMAKTTFEDFIKHIPTSLLESAFALGETYNYISITEFWNDNTINGTLQQILYYFETGLLSKELALNICKDLSYIVDHVERQTINQTIINSKNNAAYKLYKSDLLTMSNTIMVKTNHQKVFFTPFTVLTYFKIQHGQTCEEMDRFFQKQMLNSKLLVNAGERDRSLFFNKMHQKIKSVIERINADNDSIVF
ncbi:hypothetical protein GCM10011344_29170 [Dokdonia pacifica]|uniref:BetR domain-containing protein n=1 Tax=Dokdonia pacifica TaxID=1627892 RepID=A0A239C662_9FLAO|nr:hypothetical protein [Dokdonia pacifica]GGG26579.1 hypothetical protein GCM10011344_29170 [Dokdonia pacifica]SNS15148.1 hypothetical protein SAMN06265376_107126 [Dokdonia pacifica]